MASLVFDSDIDLDIPGLQASNKENEQLEAEVQEKQKYIGNYQIKLDQHQERIQAITDHLKNVKQELQHTQALLVAMKNEVQTEDHIKQINDREEERLKGALKRIRLDREELKELRNSYENTKFLAEKKAKEVKSSMKWDQQAMEAWLEEAARQDEDALTIAKYARADESKIKELFLKVERLHEQITKKRKLLDNEMIETMSIQIELDKTAEDFRMSHQEREELIGQWEKSIKQMKKRDQSMDKCAVDLARLNQDIKDKQNHVKEKQEFFDHEKENNAEKERQIKTTDRLTAKKSLQYREGETARIQMNDELETLKYSVERSATDLEKTKAKNKQLTQTISDRRMKLDDFIKQRHEMQLELKQTIVETLSEEEYAKHLDEVLAQEELAVEKIENELNHLKERHFSRSQQYFELKTKAEMMEAELHGGKATIRNLGSKQHKLDQELLKQHEIMYMQDFQLQQLQHRWRRLEGERSGEEVAILNSNIKVLEQDWERQLNDEKLLKSQLKRLQEDLRRVNRKAEKDLSKKRSLEEKIDEMNLHIDTTERDLKKAVEAKQDRMVEENIVKLGVKRLRDRLYAHADEVLSLEKRKLQLNTAMAGRMQDIEVHKGMLWAQIKSCETERQAHIAELHSQMSKIDIFKKRYEIFTMSMQPPEGEEQHSQAYYVIKAAQEKDELEKQGDAMHSKLRKIENEMAAMKNTLTMINSKNKSYRKRFGKFNESSEQFQQLKILEEKCTIAQDNFKRKKKYLHLMADDLQTMQRTLSSLESDEAVLTSKLEEKKLILAAYSKEKDDFKAKEERVSKQLESKELRFDLEILGTACSDYLEDTALKLITKTIKLMRDLSTKRTVCGYPSSHVQRDIEVRYIREFSGNIVKQLGSLATQHSDLVPNLQVLFTQAGLPPPAFQTTSKPNSAVASARSSFSSGISASSHTVRGTLPVQQPSTLDIGGMAIISGRSSASNTPGVSPRISGSTTEGRAKPASQQSSLTRSRHSSHTPSSAGSIVTGRSSKLNLDLTIGPAPHQ